ncbi:LysR family transcriptional regulator [Anaerospora hongkongensis]|jgi:DNA-binding transcriptional LysR family regulator|uniref:LysR family transcriptional regulator n=1 Tax=Anaerospora hongkongensis TaxID=244830 RepID=UPI00289C0130|nr:LysR family transcriptional regulator [Anaerospora hongkongensis]
MDFRQLKYFLAVAEEGQITKAAQRLHVTQPPLSQQLILLEKELGVQLFERGKKHIRLTEAGNILRNRAEQMMELKKVTLNDLQESTAGISGRLMIGTIPSTAGSILPGHIQKFHQRYPKVTFHVRQGETLKILELLNVGIIEIGIVRTPVDYEQYDYILLPEEDMVVGALPGMLSDCTEPLEISQLADKPLLAHHRHAAPTIVEHCRQQGLDPTLLCTSDDITLLLLWANLGLGVAIVPESAVDILPASSLTFYKLKGPYLKTTTAVLWSKKHPLSAAGSHFIEFFK